MHKVGVGQCVDVGLTYYSPAYVRRATINFEAGHRYYYKDEYICDGIVDETTGETVIEWGC
jgi:hypothetical protein